MFGRFSTADGAKPMTDFARLPGVDVLRGLAIILVVLHHTGLRIPLAASPLVQGVLPDALIDTLMARGYEAVYLFFAVSGFLITSHALARWGRLDRLDVRAFYARRAARILPCLILLVAVLAALAAAKVPHYEIHRADQSISGAVAAALGFRINWYESVTGYLPASWDVLWSLSVEEAFYLGFPLVCLTLGRRPRALLVPILIAFALALPWWRHGLHGLWLEKADAPGMAAIACGMVAALAVHRWPRMPPSTVRWLTIFGVLALLAAGPFEEALWRSVRNGFLLIVAIAGAALCAASAWRAGNIADGTTRASGASLGRLLDATIGAPLRAFGRLSYEIYLTHIFVMWFVVDAFTALLLSPPWAVLPAHLLSLALAWAMGWVSFKLWSEPGRRWVLAALAGKRARRKASGNIAAQ